MAFYVVSDGVAFNSINTGTLTCNYTIGGTFYNAVPGENVLGRSSWTYVGGGGDGSTSAQYKTGPSASFGFSMDGFTCDRNYVYRARAVSDAYGTAYGSYYYWKIRAIVATASTPTSSSVTSSTATITCNFYPNTADSTASVWLEYKKQSEATWTVADVPGSYTGYTQQTITEALTGLSGSTVYNFRLRMTRNTVNDTTLTSATGTFTTLASAPTVTTEDATSVSNVAATLNATVQPNSLSVAVSFEWDTDSGAPYANTTTPASTETGSTSRVVPKVITGLTASTPYYYRVKAVYGSTTLYGSEKTFTTSADPIAASLEDEMLPIQYFDRKYGVATTVAFVVPSPSGTSSDLLYTGAAVWAGAGESKIAQDPGTGTPGAFADTTNDPAQIGTQLYSLDLTAAEMECDEAFIVLTDSGGAARDVLLRVRTHVQLGSMEIDAATGTKANTTAFKATGYGSGHGIQGVGGATGKDILGVLGSMVLQTGTAQGGGAGYVDLATTASSTNDYYNGAIVAIIDGTGAGQARAISDYTGSSRRCNTSSWSTNPNSSSVYIVIPGTELWATSPGVELAAVPTATSSYGAMLQFLFQRFAYARKQTATIQTLYKADSTDGVTGTTFCTGAFTDGTTYQAVGKLT